jgi:uncharacterized membrane protein
VVWDRGISVLAAAVLSAVVVFYASRFLPLWSAALAGLISALGWQFWRHGWELRSYSLFALTCLLFVGALERAVRKPTRGPLVITAAVVAVGVMTHYFFLFTLGAGLIWIALQRRTQPVRPVLAAIVFGLIPLVAWMPGFYKQYEAGSYKWIGPFRPRAVVEAYAALLARSISSGAWGYVVSVLALALVLAGATSLWRTSDAARLCALSAVIPVLAAAVVWLIGPEIFLSRNLLGAAPFAAVAIAAALAALPRPLALVGTALAAAIMVAAYADTRGRIVPDYDLVATALVQEGWREQDPILVFGPPYQLLHPVDWYLPGRPLDLANWNGRSCDRVYVVSVAGRGRAMTAGVSTRRVGNIVIGRLPYRPGLAGEARRWGGRLLATRAVRCARVA